MEPGRPDDAREDLDLVASANRGDARAFEALYRRYRDWVVSLAWRFTHDRDLALDVAQETFLYLLKRFPGFELRCRMKTFLYPVVTHAAISTRRRKGRPGPPRDPPALLPDPPNDEALRELVLAVESLPQGQREVLMLRFADELPLSEIASALDIPLGTVKSRLHDALETLRGDDRARKYFEA